MTDAEFVQRAREAYWNHFVEHKTSAEEFALIIAQLVERQDREITAARKAQEIKERAG